MTSEINAGCSSEYVQLQSLLLFTATAAAAAAELE
jgi:hypothetical protein